MLQTDPAEQSGRTTHAVAARKAYRGPALFSHGFRPFFLFGAIWAAVALAIWMVSYAFGAAAIGGVAAQEWHVHEMLYGFLGAIVAGFALTAVPNWTGRLPVQGAGLAALVALWAAGRAAMFASEQLGLAGAVIDSAFLIALAGVIWREVLRGRNVRNIPVCLLVTFFAASNVGFHAGAANYAWHEVSEHTAIAVLAMLVALIGGRITPSFTRNWMAQHMLAPLPAPTDRFDAAALGAAALALAAWAAEAPPVIAGWLLLLAGAAHAARLARWRGWRSRGEPLVLILHLGYAWLPVGFLLLGASMLAPGDVHPYAAMHALTAGAFGTMTLAVMTRASLGHTGRERKADYWTVVIYALVLAGALLRVVAFLLGAQNYTTALIVSAMLWGGAFALFAIRYGPMLLKPRVDSPTTN